MSVLIGICARGAQSGKDTAGQYLIDRYGFVKVNLADAVKEMLYRLNPDVYLDGEGKITEWCGIKELVDRIDQEKISEIIFALAADVEGEATTNYIVDLLKSKPVALTRIARGIPAGGGLESADELTLSAALSGRTKL